jgi:hypothetical protein
MATVESVETPPQLNGNNYGVGRFNALRHGILSQYRVLPWEDGDEYRELIEALAAEHSPQGPTEEHLVEELAGIIWRKRRLRLAEASSYRRGLKKTTEPFGKTVDAALICVNPTVPLGSVVDALEGTDDEATELGAQFKECEGLVRRALDILKAGEQDSYHKALAALDVGTQEWWEDELTYGQEGVGEGAYRKNASDLRRFLEGEALHCYARRQTEIENRPHIRAQAFGEALNIHQLERLARYEIHLDRKLERTLAMLLKLQELHHAANPS